MKSSRGYDAWPNGDVSMRFVLEERVSEVSAPVPVTVVDSASKSGPQLAAQGEFERSSLHRARCVVVLQVSPWETFLILWSLSTCWSPSMSDSDFMLCSFLMTPERHDVWVRETGSASHRCRDFRSWEPKWSFVWRKSR